MFTEGQQVKGKEKSQYEHYKFVVTEAFDDGTFNGTVVDHAWDEDAVGEEFEDLPYGDFTVTATPTKSYSFTAPVSTTKMPTTPLAMSAEDMLALGLL